jgi:hypothetical protein
MHLCEKHSKHWLHPGVSTPTLKTLEISVPGPSICAALRAICANLSAVCADLTRVCADLSIVCADLKFVGADPDLLALRKPI